VPFFELSVHCAAWQTRFVHTAFAQSPGPVHALPSAHFFPGAHEPPQSTSVSFWFFTPSEQVAVWHVTLHTALAQSFAPVHALPSAHLVEQPPPQSVSLSAPFFTPSAHVGARHVPAGQTPL
jgi:hypothetical protein